jgi:hypothetical protein
MAETEKEEKLGELVHFSGCRAENGWKLCFQYEDKDKSLAQRAGWVPCAPCVCKDYVEKTIEGVLKRIKELVK